MSHPASIKPTDAAIKAYHAALRTYAERFDLTKPQAVADLLTRFYAFTEPDIEGFEQRRVQGPSAALVPADRIVSVCRGGNPRPLSYP